jgi:hypothetical protein
VVVPDEDGSDGVSDDRWAPLRYDLTRGVYPSRSDTSDLLAERDRYAALVDAWRPVVEAAVLWNDHYDEIPETVEAALADAVDALPDEAKP